MREPTYPAPKLGRGLRRALRASQGHVRGSLCVFRDGVPVSLDAPAVDGAVYAVVPARARLGAPEPYTLPLPPELVEAIAERAAELVLERQHSDDDGWLRGAEQIAAYIGCAPDRIYALSSAGRMEPVHRDGSALVARKSDLDGWITRGGGKRP